MRISDWSSDVCSSDLDADHHVGLRMDDQLVERALVAVGEHILHRPEVGGVDLDLTELAARLGLGHAHARHRRMAEYGGRDEIGRASGGERVGQDVLISVVAVDVQKKETSTKRE